MEWKVIYNGKLQWICRSIFKKIKNKINKSKRKYLMFARQCTHNMQRK